MSIANSNYEFMFDVTNGQISGESIIKNTNFYKALVKRKLKLRKFIQHNNLIYVFMVDETFTLRKDFYKEKKWILIDLILTNDKTKQNE